jgi:ATP phosphoribosyltransferase regulatory subunit
MRRWVLPEAIEDVLPHDAQRLETLRRQLLDMFRLRGYELVMPPLLEYLDSLLTGSGRDMDLRTFKLVDQLSGRTMGLRADITPQVARVDAHLLNRQGVTRLCYCGSVLHTLPAGLTATREPIQIGAELYGHAAIEADTEIIGMLAEALALAGVSASRLDLGHVGIFRALAAAAGLDSEREQELFALLQGKDLPALRELVRDVPEPQRSAFLALPECYGGIETLDAAARVLPDSGEIRAALGALHRLAAELRDLPVGFDLADLRGYHYHSGVVFAAYCDGYPGAVALGGRYDKVGRAFGRGRPATGFSMDLREVARLTHGDAAQRAILAPSMADKALERSVAELRSRGEIVVVALAGHEGTWHETGCDRRLVKHGEAWVVEPMPGD